jgi:hypothetical protein
MYIKNIQVLYLKCCIINLILAYLVNHIKYFLHIYELYNFVSLKQNIYELKKVLYNIVKNTC